MTTSHPEHSVEVAGHVLVCGPVRVVDDELVVTFDVSGPDASPRFPKEHVIFIRPGDPQKLDSLGGQGVQWTADTASFEWHLRWPGGEGVDVVYFEQDNLVVHVEFLAV